MLRSKKHSRIPSKDKYVVENHPLLSLKEALRRKNSGPSPA